MIERQPELELQPYDSHQVLVSHFTFDPFIANIVTGEALDKKLIKGRSGRIEPVEMYGPTPVHISSIPTIYNS